MYPYSFKKMVQMNYQIQLVGQVYSNSPCRGHWYIDAKLNPTHKSLLSPKFVN